MKNIFFVAGISYIAIFTGMAFGQVGETIGGEPWIMGTDMVFKIFALITVPFALGYLSGIDDRDAK